MTDLPKPAPLADPIVVPPVWRNYAVSGLPASGRLCHVLNQWGCRTLGDLEGRDYGQMRSLPNCGWGTISELRRLLVRAARRVERDADVEGEPPTGIVFIPAAARGGPLASLPLSVRLGNICQRAGLRLLGDLHGLSYEEFSKMRNCGRNSLRELARVVRRAQAGEFDPSPAPSAPETAAPDPSPGPPGSLQVPEFARAWALTALPVSPRLMGVCEALGCRELGGLHGRWPSELLNLRNCGRSTVAELVNLLSRVRAGEFSPAEDDEAGGHGLPELTRFLDERIPRLPARTREALLARLGGDGAGTVPTLEEVGARFGVTRERIRQLVSTATEHVRREGGPRLASRLGRLADRCLETVVPLTPELFAHLGGSAAAAGAFPLAFYLRLFGEMEERLPVWPSGKDGGWLPTARELGFYRDLRARLVARDGAPEVLADMLTAMREQPDWQELGAGEFLGALRNIRAPVRVDFTDPERPLLSLGRRHSREWVGQVLRESNQALTPEEILARASSMPDTHAESHAASSILNLAGRQGGIYLLGPRRLGLRDHFQLPGPDWEAARADFAALLRRENRPVSTAEVVNGRRFVWTARTNAHELAEILAEDARFTDLGKFLFALRVWGVEERQRVADLVPEILCAVGHPLSSVEIADRLQRFRSASTSSLNGWLGRMAGVRDYGFGYWGLAAADEAADRLFLAGREDYVNRAISRAEPPLTFALLCDLLRIPADGSAGARLWATIRALPRARLSTAGPRPDPAAQIAHARWRVERTLPGLLAEAGEPLPLYELQWRLNDRCPFAFADQTHADLERSLRGCPAVAQTPAGHYFLEDPAGHAGEEAGGLRARCAEILQEANALLGCEDLLDRMAAGGTAVEEVSPTMLAACLRSDALFEEIGRHRFRLRPGASRAHP